MYAIKGKPCSSKIGSKVVSNMSVICFMRMVFLDRSTIFSQTIQKKKEKKKLPRFYQEVLYLRHFLTDLAEILLHDILGHDHIQ